MLGFFNDNGGGLGATEFVRLLRNVDGGGEKSVSSRLSESDFEFTDNELALRWSRKSSKNINRVNIHLTKYLLVLMVR